MGTLYLVGTPIGNLEDITLRALRTLREASLIAAEDTRTTGRLLKHHEIDTPLTSFHEYSDEARIGELIDRLAVADVALVTDAGMPGLSDPGYRLVRAAVEAGVTVSPIPGPSAAVSALISSGLPTDSFLFLGFLPRQRKARREALANAGGLPYTLVIYEAPHRLVKLLKDVDAVLGDRPLVVARELTKLHEEIWRGTAGDAIEYFGKDRVRGEITVVIRGAGEEEAAWSEAEVERAMARLLADGVRRKEAAERVAAQAGWRKREVYDLSLRQE
ncbi:MAG: 16S rRNA (cytidine(1402)-2'-O)-methyltransferase [Candidatus Promineifilaceae bacterium]|nr:16S rRNA (cytidine(1402)-2'-O)-methyltransferase [Candidatus Promineifilaceae bacterium]